MNKEDYLYIILDNVLAFNIVLPQELIGNNLKRYLNRLDKEQLKIIAGFNKNILEFFLNVAPKKDSKEFEEIIKKLEKLAYLIGPLGPLNYLTDEQIYHVFKYINSMRLEDINKIKISEVADEFLYDRYGNVNSYSLNEALENQLASAAFYLRNMGYSDQEIREKFKEVQDDPKKIEELFTLPPKEIINVPTDDNFNQTIANLPSPPANPNPEIVEQKVDLDLQIEKHLKEIHQDVMEERKQKVEELLKLIKEHVRDTMSDVQERVFRQMHPDRLRRALKMLKTTKRRSKRMKLYIDWFTLSLLLSRIELKVEHWQVSSSAGLDRPGVYTAGIDFSRYDNIIKEFPDNKLAKVVNIASKILQNPTKRAIQKLGQDLIAETGFDEHLYFVD